MKKTVTINISGMVFHIDEDAYEKLRNYLSKISSHFNREKDGREIISDIESRIAELFSSKLSAERNVVDISMVDQVIELMGMPEDFVEIEEPFNEQGASAGSNQQYYSQKSKKLYRDPESMVIAGVCSGLAHYLNMDKVLARVLFILLFFLTSGVAIPVYIILWIAVPKARTIAQKLEMRGDPINVENIGKKVKEEKESFSSTDQHSAQYGYQKKNDGPSVISKVFGFILILFGFFSFLALIVGIVATSKLVGLLPGFIHTPDHDLFFNHLFSQSLGSTMVMSILIIVGIPLLLIIYFGTKLMFNYIANSRSVFLSALGIWVIGIIIAISSIAGAVNVFSTSATESETKNLAFPSDTIYIKLAKSTVDPTNYSIGINSFKVIGSGKNEQLIATPKFSIEESRGNYVELILNKYAKGNNYKSARKNASKITYQFSVSGDTLILDPYFELGDREKWRSQGIDVTLNLPAGKTAYLDESLLPAIHEIENRSDIWEGDMVGKYWKMEPEGLTISK